MAAEAEPDKLLMVLYLSKFYEAFRSSPGNDKGQALLVFAFVLLSWKPEQKMWTGLNLIFKLREDVENWEIHRQFNLGINLKELNLMHLNIERVHSSH